MSFLEKPLVSPVLVGRQQELEILEHALYAAQGGTGQCIVIAGDAGVGKSRLIAEIRQLATAEGFATLQGYCFEQDVTFPYAPLVDALRTYLAQRAKSDIGEILGPFASEIVKLLPELALFLSELEATPLLDREAEKRRLFESLILFFMRLAARQPLLIIFEDLHWSDNVSLDFLALFARRVSFHPILLLTSYRREDVTPHLTHLLAQVNRERLVSEISLGPLTRPEVAALLRAIFHLSSPVKAEFLDLLYPPTEGNPFIIEELLKTLISAGVIIHSGGEWELTPIDELHVPHSLQEAVQRRAGLLGNIAKEVLTLAAVAGRRFGFAQLHALIDLNEQELLQAIKELIAAQLLVEEAADNFAFRHALTREAVYSTLLQRERVALHLRVAVTLERDHAQMLDHYVADLAHHYFAAEAWSETLKYAWRAGEKAQAVYAPHEAISHFTRALKAARRMSLSSPPDILHARGKACETVGYFEAARGDYEQVLRTARSKHDGMLEWQSLIDLGFLWASRDYARAGDYFQRALEIARDVDNPATVGHSLNRLGNWYANLGQPAKALRHHHEALELFQTKNDRRGMVDTLDLVGMASQMNSDLIQSHVAFQRAIDLWRELAERWGLASTLGSLPLCAPNYLKALDVPATSLTEAISAGEEAVRLARDIGWRAGEAYALLNLALSLGPMGEYAQAMEAVHMAHSRAVEIEHRQWTAVAQAVLGVLYLDLLVFDAARSHLEQALTTATAVGSRIWKDTTTGYLATALAAQGEFARAEDLLKDVVDNETPMLTQPQRLCWYAHGQIALARGEAAIALRIAGELIASAPNVNEHAKHQAIIPSLWQLRGEALIALDIEHEVEPLLQAAQRTAADQGARSLLWRIQAILGKLCHAQKRWDDAQLAYSAAHNVIVTLSSNVPDETVRDCFVERALQRLPRLPSPSAAHAERAQFGGLTARQREVAVLIAQGKSNREIAEELVIGVRTVEAHVTRIFNTLGFSSRAQVAAWIVDKDLE